MNFTCKCYARPIHRYAGWLIRMIDSNQGKRALISFAYLPIFIIKFGQMIARLMNSYNIIFHYVIYQYGQRISITPQSTVHLSIYTFWLPWYGLSSLICIRGAVADGVFLAIWINSGWRPIIQMFIDNRNWSISASSSTHLHNLYANDQKFIVLFLSVYFLEK